MIELSLILFVLGASIGSFLNVCTMRMPNGISVVGVASACPACKRELGFAELIPLVSFVSLRGRCRSCGAAIAWRYPVYELFGGIVLVLLFLEMGPAPSFVVAAVFVLLMSVIAVIDWEHLIIPDDLVITGIVAGLALQALVDFRHLTGAMLSAAGAGFTVAAIRLTGNRLFKRESMGLGDVKLAGVIGLFLGFGLFLEVLWMAALVGSVYGTVIGLLSWRKREGRQWTPLDSARGDDGVRGFSADSHAMGLRKSVIGNPGYTLSHPTSPISHPALLPFGSFLALSASIVIVFQDFFDGLIHQWLTSLP